jgi:hypothetical protein
MIKEKITLPDGRYLIYYRFEDEENPTGIDAGHEDSPDELSSKREPDIGDDE